MPITTDLYIPDSGSVTVNGTEHNGSVKSVDTSAPRKTERKVNSLGGSKTLTQSRAKTGDFELTMVIFDDGSLTFANRATTSLLSLMWEAYENDTALTDLIVVPAGSTTGMSEYTMSGINVVQCPPFGQMDADSEVEATVDVIVTVESLSIAATT